MKEKRADAARGTGYAILLHAVLIGLLLFGLHRVSQQGGESGGDGALQADVASVDDLSAKTRRALLGEPKEATQPLPQPIEPAKETPPPVEPTPQPKPEPSKPEPSKPEPKPVVKETPPVDMGKRAPMPEPAKREPVPNRKAEAELAAKAAEAAEKSARAASLAKQRAEQMADARSQNSGRDASASSARAGVGAGKSNNSGQQKWLDAVGRAIESKWVRPDDIPPGQECPIHIRIIPGGEVIAVTVLPGCPYSAEAKRSVEKAVRDASPLPFKGYEDVYTRDFTANFRPSR